MVRVWFRTLSGATMGARVPEACTGADLCGVLGRALGEPQPCGVRLFADGRCIAATDVVRPRADQAFLAVLSVTSLVGDVLGRRPAPAGVPAACAPRAPPWYPRWPPRMLRAPRCCWPPCCCCCC